MQRQHMFFWVGCVDGVIIEKIVFQDLQVQEVLVASIVEIGPDQPRYCAKNQK